MLGREILCVVALLAATSNGIEMVENGNSIESIISVDDLNWELLELLELQKLQDAKPDSSLSDQNSNFSLSNQSSESLSSNQGDGSSLSNQSSGSLSSNQSSGSLSSNQGDGFSLSNQSSGSLSSAAHEGEDARRLLSDLSRQDKLNVARVVAESVSPLVRLLSFWWRGASEPRVKHVSGCEKEEACDVNAVCITIFSPRPTNSYLCRCFSGFHGSGDPGQCFDVDECLSDPCDVNAVCINTMGSFSCSCKTGYIGSGEPGNCTVNKADLTPGPAEVLIADPTSVTVRWSPPAFPNVGYYRVEVNGAHPGWPWEGFSSDTRATFPYPLSSPLITVKVTAIWPSMVMFDGENVRETTLELPSK